MLARFKFSLSHEAPHFLELAPKAYHSKASPFLFGPFKLETAREELQGSPQIPHSPKQISNKVE